MPRCRARPVGLVGAPCPHRRRRVVGQQRKSEPRGLLHPPRCRRTGRAPIALIWSAAACAAGAYLRAQIAAHPLRLTSNDTRAPAVPTAALTCSRAGVASRAPPRSQRVIPDGLIRTALGSCRGGRNGTWRTPWAAARRVFEDAHHRQPSRKADLGRLSDASAVRPPRFRGRAFSGTPRVCVGDRAGSSAAGAATASEAVLARSVR